MNYALECYYLDHPEQEPAAIARRLAEAERAAEQAAMKTFDELRTEMDGYLASVTDAELCRELMGYGMEFDRPPCGYCDEPGHADDPCPVRVADVDRFVATGRAIYPSQNA